MPSRDLEQISTVRPTSIGQATAVEQARAVAEVQAAVVVAQQVPRDMGRAVADMRDACGRIGMASRAFYTIPRKGAKPVNGATVHLARELARIFGNVQYGVHELRRDDDAGISEIQAFAWDVERNVRSTRTFVVPHQRMANQKRQPIIDLGEVYLNNQNVGARAVRECIFTILPAWFTDEAQDLCRETMNNGEGKPLDQRITDAVRLFGELGVQLHQLEERTGRKRGSWAPADLADLRVLYGSINRGEVSLEEVFPRRVTAEEITAGAPPAAPAPAPAPATEVTAPEPDPNAWDDVQVAQVGGQR